MGYYTVEVRRIDVIGTIWLPPVTAAMSYDLSAYDVENLGELTRENVARWLETHSGDFQHVQDFRADIGPFFSDWEKGEESDCIFSDCMYPADY